MNFGVFKRYIGDSFFYDVCFCKVLYKFKFYKLGFK